MAFMAACTIRSEFGRAKALSMLASHLPDRLMKEALTVGFAISDGNDRMKTLRALVPYLPEWLMEEALTAACTLKDESHRADALGALALCLPEKLMEDVLTTASTFKEYYYASALGSLAPHLPERLMEDALTTACAIEDEHCRARALRGLAAHLPEGLQEVALMAAQMLADKYDLTEILGALAPHLPERLIGMALKAASSIRDESHREKALSVLIPYLPAELLEDTLKTVCMIENEGRARLLGKLGPHLTERLMEVALTAAYAIKNKDDSDIALTGLASHISEKEALMIACSIEKANFRANVLRNLVDRFNDWPQQAPNLAYHTWIETLPVLAARPRPQFLQDLAVLMPFILALAGDEAPQAAEGIFHAIQEVCAWWP